MFPFHGFRKAKPQTSRRPNRPAGVAGFEPLEGRQLLSATPAADHHGHGDHGHGHGGSFGGGGPGGGGGPSSTIAFSLAPAAVQTGLDALATTDGLADPTATTKVALGNTGGVETYTVTLTATGTVSRLTVDAAGDPVTAPTQTTTTFANLPAAASAEVTAIATAKGLTAPASTDTVNVSTTSAGAVTYSVGLASTDTSDDAFPHDVNVQVDASGNPVGDQELPFSVFSTAVQAALNAGAPTGATALAATATQAVDVRTSDGITTYSTTFTVTGTTTTVTVNAAGAAVTAASHTTADFSAIPTAAQTELQTLAVAEGYSGTIPTTQTVTVYIATGGSPVLYAVTLSVTDTSTTTSTGSTGTHDQTFVVDASGNPTTLPEGQGGGFGFGGFGFGGFGFGGFSFGRFGDGGFGPTGSTTTTTTSTGTSTSTAAKSTGLATSSTALTGRAAAGTYAGLTSVNPTLAAALAGLGVAPDAAVSADLAQLRTDAAALKADLKGLSKADAATYKADEKALAVATKAAAGSTAALRADAAKYAGTLRADEATIRKDHASATALATAQAKLAADEAAAFAALSADLDALRALVSANAGVTAAQAKLATDLPTVAAAQTAVQTDADQIVTDLGTQLTA